MASSVEVEEVRRRTDIVDLVGAYVALKKAGHVFKGLCPFHNEKTPSFQVNPDRGTWYCFGQCSEGGDVFSFLQKIENLSFPEALERLASRAGITLTPFSPRAGSASYEPGVKDRLLAAVEAATQFYEETLTRAQVARDYLQRRAISAESQRRFRIGFAGDDSEALMRCLERRGIKPRDAVDAGVVVASDYGGYRDKLWGRVVFPIIDVQERPIAFGGRLMETIEGRPKYLNSAETMLFSKGRTLYGLWLARKAIAANEKAVVVEGYMDVVACHQAGFDNVVATLGTALTADHAALIKRYAPCVLLAFDADAAGMKAARKADVVFRSVDMETRMLQMPDGEDPDSLMREGRKERFEQALTGALKVTEFQLRKMVALANEQNLNPEERLTLFRREGLPLIRGEKSVSERQRYVGIVAPLHPYYFSMNSYAAEEQIQQEIEGRPPQLSPDARRERGNWRRNGNKEYSKGEYSRREFRGRDFSRPRSTEPAEAPTPPPRAAESAEKTVIRALVEGNRDIIGIIVSQLEPEDLVTPDFWKLILYLRDGAEPMEALRRIQTEDPGLHAAIARVAAEGDGALTTLSGETSPLNGPIIVGCMTELRERRLDRYEQDLRRRANEGDLQAQIELPIFIRRRKSSKVA